MGAHVGPVTIISVRFEKKVSRREIVGDIESGFLPPGRRSPPSVNQVSEAVDPRSGRRRVAAVVGLTLLEVLQRQDLPEEVLEAEDPSITMPRRLGLSDVIERRIRMYRDEVKRGGKLTDEEVGDLIRLVIRRPDAGELLYRVGRILSGEDGRREKRWNTILPAPVSFAFARRAMARRCRKLFGRRVGAYTSSPFTLESQGHVLIRSDPGGEACTLVTGLAEALLQRRVGAGCRVSHDRCQGRGQDACRWTVLQEDAAEDVEGVSDLLLNPEPGAG